MPRCAGYRSSNAGSADARHRGDLLQPSWCWRRRRPMRRIRHSPSFSCRPSIVAKVGRDSGDAAPPRAPHDPEIWAAHHAVVEGETIGEARSKPTGRVSSAAAAACARRRRDGRRPSVQYGRHGARSGVRAASPGAHCRRRDRAHRVLDQRRGVARRRARSRRQAPGCQCLRARGDTRLDAGAGAAAPPRHRRGGGRPLSALAGTCCMPTPRCGHRRIPSAAAAAAPAALWAHGISGDLPIVLVRIDDVDDIGIVAAAAARARILADEAACGGSRDPERASSLLRAGSAERARDTGAHEPVAAADRRGRRARRGLHAAHRSDPGRDARAAVSGGARRAGRRSAAPWPISSIASSRRRPAAVGASAAARRRRSVPGAPPPRARVLQRTRRLRGRRPRVRDAFWAGPGDARARGST